MLGFRFKTEIFSPGYRTNILDLLQPFLYEYKLILTIIVKTESPFICLKEKLLDGKRQYNMNE